MTQEYRYYYNDPVNALWMEKNYQLKYESSGGHHLDNTYADPLVYNYVTYDAKQKNGKFNGKKYYLRKHTYHVLTPKNGDLGLDRLGMMCWYLDNKWHCDIDHAKNTGFQPAEPVSLLARMGKPFIAPIAEEVAALVVVPDAPEVVVTPKPERLSLENLKLMKEAMNKGKYIYLMQWNTRDGVYVFPEVITDLRPLKNLMDKPVEIKTPKGLTVKLLHSQEIYDISKIHKQLQLKVG